MTRQVEGATLIELVATIGVLAVLSAIAVPGMGSLKRNAVRAATLNDLLHSIYIARNESIARNTIVSICRSRDGHTCANAAPNWNDGWIVFENRDRDQPADTDPGEPVLYSRGAIDGGTLTSTRKSFSFRPYLQADVNGSLVYCPAPKSTEGRAIIVNHAGRPRTTSRDASGKTIIC
jgi:type IV fimbrial biogenesis protein FimT